MIDFGTVLLVTLGPRDLAELQQGTRVLGRSSAATFLRLAGGAVSDTAGVALLAPVVLPASNYSVDLVAPQLRFFNVSLDSRLLTLVFDEPVEGASLVAANVTLGANLTLSPATRVVGGASAGPVLGLLLSPADFNRLALDRQLFDSVATSVLSLGAGAVRDVAGNPCVAVAGLQADAFAPDTTAGRLNSVNLDMKTGLLSLVFSEAMDASTLDVTKLAIQNSRNASRDARARRLEPLVYPLTADSQVTSGNSDVLVVRLASAQLAILQRLDGVAKSRGTTFVSMGPGAVRDMAGNEAEAVSSSDALGVAELVPASSAKDSLTGVQIFVLALGIAALLILVLFLAWCTHRCEYSPSRLSRHGGTRRKEGKSRRAEAETTADVAGAAGEEGGKAAAAGPLQSNRRYKPSGRRWRTSQSAKTRSVAEELAWEHEIHLMTGRLNNPSLELLPVPAPAPAPALMGSSSSGVDLDSDDRASGTGSEASMVLHQGPLPPPPVYPVDLGELPMYSSTPMAAQQSGQERQEQHQEQQEQEQQHHHLDRKMRPESLMLPDALGMTAEAAIMAQAETSGAPACMQYRVLQASDRRSNASLYAGDWVSLRGFDATRTSAVVEDHGGQCTTVPVAMLAPCIHGTPFALSEALCPLHRIVSARQPAANVQVAPVPLLLGVTADDTSSLHSFQSSHSTPQNQHVDRIPVPVEDVMAMPAAPAPAAPSSASPLPIPPTITVSMSPPPTPAPAVFSIPPPPPPPAPAPAFVSIPPPPPLPLAAEQPQPKPKHSVVFASSPPEIFRLDSDSLAMAAMDSIVDDEEGDMLPPLPRAPAQPFPRNVSLMPAPTQEEENMIISDILNDEPASPPAAPAPARAPAQLLPQPAQPAQSARRPSASGPGRSQSWHEQGRSAHDHLQNLVRRLSMANNS